METWLEEAREALLRRRSRMHARGAQDSRQMQQPVMLSENDHQELCDIEDALVRIQEGAYGRCSRCGGAIGRHRLRAIPETRYCLTCSALVRADIESAGLAMRVVAQDPLGSTHTSRK